ncbi:MAG: LysR substrate-binding domain-containing protein [Acidimicrobiales bacterium]
MTEINVSNRALRILVAATNAGSFTAAADELGMGQPAVSHAITRLETAVGTALLVRSRSGVRPTATGAELIADLAPSFERIDQAVDRARGAHDPTVTVSVSTSLASWWLLPRLPDFKRMHPDVSLRLITADADADTDPTRLDLWIPLGLVDRPDLDVVRLCDEALYPVAAPALAERLDRNNASALVDAPLLHLEERYRTRFDWNRWFQHHGIDQPIRLDGDRSNDYSVVLQAALDGQGVALGWNHIVSDLVSAGRLVPLAAPVVTEDPFVIATSSRRQLRPGAKSLRAWLIEHMTATAAALPPGTRSSVATPRRPPRR